jgi:uncharacterized protein (TIGR02145 family)
LEECPQDSSACDLSADYIDNKNHVRGICPAGYHMPTDSDYVELERYFAEKYSAEVDGNLIYVAKYLLSPYKWDNMEERGLRKAKRDFTNESGFTVLPSGGAVRDDTGSWIFSVQSWGARYWTSSRNSNYMSCWEGSGIDDYVLLWICDLYGIYSIRCLKD